jgi:hypothetical protein
MLKNRERVFLILGIVLSVALAITSYFTLNNWFISQLFFHIPLITAVYLLFKPRFSFFVFSLICWVCYVLAKFDIIDYHLYKIFIRFDLFPDMFKLAEWTNPQYTKLMVYYIVVPLLLMLLLFKKQRSLMRYFVLISCVTSCILTAVLHKYIIQDFLYYNKILNVKKMNSVVNFLNEQKNITADVNTSVCKQFNLDCRADVSANEISQIMLDEKLSKFSKSEVATYFLNTAENKTHVWFSGVSAQKKNAEYIVGLITKNKKNYLYLDKADAIEKIWFFKAIFIKISAIGYFVWSYLLILVGIVHLYFYDLRKKNVNVK